MYLNLHRVCELPVPLELVLVVCCHRLCDLCADGQLDSARLFGHEAHDAGVHVTGGHAVSERRNLS
jgi:hypothetical protein